MFAFAIVVSICLTLYTFEKFCEQNNVAFVFMIIIIGMIVSLGVTFPLVREMAYDNGQIDALNGKQKYHLVDAKVPELKPNLKTE